MEEKIVAYKGFDENLRCGGFQYEIGKEYEQKDEIKCCSSGGSAQIGSSGYSAKIGSSGGSAQINSTGKYAVICCASDNSMVKAKIGSWITLAEWDYSEEKKCPVPVCVKTEYVDGKRIKADTWYKLVNGEFKEV